MKVKAMNCRQGFQAVMQHPVIHQLDIGFFDVNHYSFIPTIQKSLNISPQTAQYRICLSLDMLRNSSCFDIIPDLHDLWLNNQNQMKVLFVRADPSKGLFSKFHDKYACRDGIIRYIVNSNATNNGFQHSEEFGYLFGADCDSDCNRFEQILNIPTNIGIDEVMKVIMSPEFLKCAEIDRQLGPAPNAYDKRFECRWCGLTFVSNFHLLVHERIHTGEKPFICSYCSRPFAHKANLKTHLIAYQEKGKDCPEWNGVKCPINGCKMLINIAKKMAKYQHFLKIHDLSSKEQRARGLL